MTDPSISSSIDRSRLAAYLLSLEKTADCMLTEMRRYAVQHDVPIVRPETEAFLRTMVKLTAPKHILEVGTAIAYSTIVMAHACSAEIYTIESYDKRIPIAEENIKKAGLTQRIKLVHADAGAELKKLDGRYDLIFLDAAKAQYIVWLPDILRLMKKGSVLIADNVLQEETVMESRFAVSRRERTIHERMREFLYAIKHDDRLETSVLPVGDGVSLSLML